MSIKYIFITSLVIIFMTITYFLIEDESNVSVSSFGATSGDNLEDTDTIQKAINSISKQGGGTVKFSKGIYLIDSLQSIQLRDNVTLKFEKGTILKSIPNSSERFELVRIHDVKNVNIIGNVEVVGERNEHEGVTGEWGFGISIRGSNDVYIENVNVRDFWGDGIYIGSTEKQNYNKNVVIKNARLHNNRRQGISIISAKDLKIINPVITNTNGTAPQSGIDIEPNHELEYLENIEIINMITENNKGYGLQIYLKNLRDSKNPISINVNNTKEITDGIFINEVDNIKGKIRVGEIYYLNVK